MTVSIRVQLQNRYIRHLQVMDDVALSSESATVVISCAETVATPDKTLAADTAIPQTLS